MWLGVGLTLIYLVPITPSLFTAKRGLMLGRSGIGVYFPSGTSEHGIYERGGGAPPAGQPAPARVPTDLAIYLVYPALCLVGLALWRRARTNRW